DIVSSTAGDKNPNFVNFTPQSTIDINAGTTKSENIPQTFNDSWDFPFKIGFTRAYRRNQHIYPSFWHIWNYHRW
ncbi:MAG: hypothetical protein QM751_15125, partial [Paludibacteraceae bacterium]